MTLRRRWAVGIPILAASLAAPGLSASSDARTAAADEVRCADRAETATELPVLNVDTQTDEATTSLSIPRNAIGRSPRADVQFGLHLMPIVDDAVGRVTLSVNGRSFALLEIVPTSSNDWRIMTGDLAGDSEPSKAAPGDFNLPFSNFLQDDSLHAGTNKLTLRLENEGDTVVQSASIREGSTLVTDARSPHLLALLTPQDPSVRELQTSRIDVFVEAVGDCSISGVDVQVESGPRPPPGLDVAEQHIAQLRGSEQVTFDLPPLPFGRHDLVFSADAPGQDGAIAIVELVVTRRGERPVVRYLIYAAAAVALWLIGLRLLGSRRQPPSTPKS
jgi:hypothetical protein